LSTGIWLVTMVERCSLGTAGAGGNSCCSSSESDNEQGQARALAAKRLR